jgi:hypothetical protein
MFRQFMFPAFTDKLALRWKQMKVEAELGTFHVGKDENSEDNVEI